ncbi:dolichol-phosphate mannosyltransferase [Acuticoccus sediminis]|uniref:Dolichol-phosphate mannosyltransferase n=1 Tax=Acuticoccus sediminis TaxID=2184697 RepID=A0A8B2NVH1_9HYPH|nr:glycosyltransferase family 2 protein [Acuticoccus sediminis]RAH99726.1 dolichol-phosphate mannosyltransferase [Acuticoccus sediminis]
MSSRAPESPVVSILIPAKDEAGSIADVLHEITASSLGSLGVPYEFVVIDDGSTDGTARAALGAGLPNVRVLRHEKSGGKSRAIRAGALAARGEILVTMDGDGQNDPQFLAALVAPLLSDPAVGIVAGQRTRRHDGWQKKFVSKVANRTRRALLADDTRDTACGLKAMRRDVYLTLPFFDNNHRFYPALFMREGWRVGHVDVADRPRTTGQSKYGVLDRALVGLPDLLGMWWLRRRAASRPTAVEVTRESVDG